jgi:hypothetical protein
VVVSGVWLHGGTVESRYSGLAVGSIIRAEISTVASVGEGVVGMTCGGVDAIEGTICAQAGDATDILAGVVLSDRTSDVSARIALVSVGTMEIVVSTGVSIVVPSIMVAEAHVSEARTRVVESRPEMWNVIPSEAVPVVPDSIGDVLVGGHVVSVVAWDAAWLIPMVLAVASSLAAIDVGEGSLGLRSKTSVAVSQAECTADRLAGVMS